MRCGWEEGGRGVSDWWFFSLVSFLGFVFGGFVWVPLFSFSFSSGEREKGGFGGRGFFFLQVPSTTRIPHSSSHRPFPFLNIHSTDDPPSKKDISKNQKEKEEKKKKNKLTQTSAPPSQKTNSNSPPSYT